MTKGAERVERDGKTWYWCPYHVFPGKYNGLYVTHRQEDHEEWKKKRDTWRAKKPENKGKNIEAKLTRCDLTDAQADALLRECQEESDF